ncbi:polyketide synthase dehydratase-domain-containing protein [Ustulina deusta]|nr:polyketide synthase dehydratase-domain-containing protein [Ustulina deusta]
MRLVNGRMLYPGAGMLVMAIEAAKELAGQSCKVDGYTLRGVRLEGPMDLSNQKGSLEVQTTLRESKDHLLGARSFEFTIQTCAEDSWLLNCVGIVSVQYSQVVDDWSISRIETQQKHTIRDLLSPTVECTKRVDSQDMYQFLKKHGLEYGPFFQAIQDQRYHQNGKKAIGKMTPFHPSEHDCIIHPISMDAIMHLSFTALTSGGSRPMATSVPTRIEHVYVSIGDGDCSASASNTVCSSITSVTQHGFTCSGIAVNSHDSRTPRLWYEGLEMTNVTVTPNPLPLPNPRQYCMNIHCKVALALLEFGKPV